MASSSSASSSSSPIHWSGCCSFRTRDEFDRFEQKLVSEQSVGGEITHAAPLSFKALAASLALDAEGMEHKDPFLATFRAPSRLDRELEAAHNTVASKGPFKAPSSHSFRDETMAKWRAGDFCTKFALPSNQDLRRRVALDQEGFFSNSAIRAFDGTKALARLEQELQAPHKPDFQLFLPHTTSKQANLELQLEKIIDQQGLLPNLTEVRSHKFRDDSGLE